MTNRSKIYIKFINYYIRIGNANFAKRPVFFACSKVCLFKKDTKNIVRTHVDQDSRPFYIRKK